jgi:hypothetical protein
MTALGFGLLPALRAAGIDALPALKISGAPSRSSARIPLGRTLVVSQIAVSLVLLVAAGLFVRSLQKLEQIDTGFDPDHVLLLSVSPPLADHPLAPEDAQNLYRRLLARAEAIAGVRAASASSGGVFNRGTWGQVIHVEGFTSHSGTTPRTFVNTVSPRYFDVMQIAVRRGRAFTDADRDVAPRVAVVNRTFAR